jgi:phosphopantetheinyl transferase (holo-ACP synthase)
MSNNANLTIREYQEDGSFIDRPMTAEEIAQNQADAEAHAAREAEEEAVAKALADIKASARAKLVSGTPLTPEEAATLVI